jgi:hypothetical protein
LFESRNPQFANQLSIRVPIPCLLNYNSGAGKMNWGFGGRRNLPQNDDRIGEPIPNSRKRVFASIPGCAATTQAGSTPASKIEICALILTKRFRLGKSGKTPAFLKQNQLISAFVFVDYPSSPRRVKGEIASFSGVSSPPYVVCPSLKESERRPIWFDEGADQQYKGMREC